MTITARMWTSFAAMIADGAAMMKTRHLELMFDELMDGGAFMTGSGRKSKNRGKEIVLVGTT